MRLRCELPFAARGIGQAVVAQRQHAPARAARVRGSPSIGLVVSLVECWFLANRLFLRHLVVACAPVYAKCRRFAERINAPCTHGCAKVEILPENTNK